MTEPQSITTRFFNQIGARILDFSSTMGGFALLGYQTIRVLLRGQVQFPLLFEQAYRIGIRSLPLTNLVAIFTGMVMALQFIVGLERFGLELYSGQVVGIAITRELGPVLTAIMVAARVGSGVAAELGSMTVTEQVLAMEAMGANPVTKLVLPRVLVICVVTPILTIIADVVGILGGLVITVIEAGVTAQFYLDQVLRTIQIDDFLSGIGKTVFFGFLIGTISCYQGLKTTRGTAGVGQATTQAVVNSCVAVFVADYFLTKIFLLF